MCGMLWGRTPCGTITSFGNPQQLKHVLIEEWALLPLELLDNPVLNTEKRCQATIAVRAYPYEGTYACCSSSLTDNHL
ncbi:hypothetical protein TNCV_108291 [Trichonephila clavipes]|nr:hypothetical protein TNCV_108291 [Trichonephila clavipes]